MNKFFCDKRYDISFSDFHKLIKLILPTNYDSEEYRGIYRQEYQPCNIVTIKNKTNDESYNIYTWLGKKGLTILADTDFAVSLCTEVLKEVKQNPENYRILSFDIVDENNLIDLLTKDYLVYKQLNNSKNTSKYIIKEYNNDSCNLEFFYEPDSLRLSGDQTSLFTFIQLSINKLLNDNKS